MRALLSVCCMLLGAAACAGSTGMPSGDAVPLQSANAGRTHFAIDGTMYVIALAEVTSGVVGAIQGYTGSRPQLQGSIAGMTSGVDTPASTTTDRHGNVFVANGLSGRSCDDCGITEYAAGQYGNISPMATIPSSATVYGMSVDPNENLYTAGHSGTSNGKYGANVVYRYVRGAFRPSRQLERRYGGEGIALDGSGKIYLSTSGNGYKGNGALEVFAAGVRGSSRPIGVITGPDTGMSLPRGVAIDASGNIYVAEYNGSITVYAAGSTNGDLKPIRTIAGSKTGLIKPTFLSFDANGDLFVDDTEAYAIFVFAPGANDDATPIATFKTPRLQYDPYGLAVFPSVSPGV